MNQVVRGERDGQRCEGKVALVTGASRGLGAAIARRLASEGAVVACAARTMEPDPRYAGTLGETIDAIDRAGGRAAAFRADVSKAEDRGRLIEQVVDTLGPVDILVNNAAVTYFEPVESFVEKRFRLMVETQLWATIDLSQQVVPAMRAGGEGWILNMTSRAAVRPIGPPYEAFYTDFGSSVYGMCKAGLDRLTMGMAAELRASGIAVNALAPWDNVATAGASTHQLVAGYDLEPEELVAEAALQLCTGDPRVLTGRVAYSQSLLAELGVVARGVDGAVLASAT